MDAWLLVVLRRWIDGQMDGRIGVCMDGYKGRPLLSSGYPRKVALGNIVTPGHSF